MTILKTYARMFVDRLDDSLPFLEHIVGQPADLRFPVGPSEMAAIGNFLVIAGPPEDVEKYRGMIGPVVVSDLDELETRVKQSGGVITQPRTDTPIGAVLYATHPDGSRFEYIQFLPQLVEQIIKGLNLTTNGGYAAQ